MYRFPCPLHETWLGVDNQSCNVEGAPLCPKESPSNCPSSNMVPANICCTPDEAWEWVMLLAETDDPLLAAALAHAREVEDRA